MLLSTCKHHSNLTSSDQIVTALNVSCWEHITTSLLYQSPDTALNDDADEFIQLPSLLWLVPGDIDVAALTQRHHSSRTRIGSFNHLVRSLHVFGFVVNMWFPCMPFNRISALWDGKDLN